jgi:hypothetical protein
MSNNIVPMQQTAPAPAPAWRGARLKDLDDQLRFSKLVTAGGMAPASYFRGNVDPVAAIFSAVQLGGEIGLSPMASIQNIAVINGRPGLWGSAMLAVVEASGKLADIDEFLEGEGKARKAVCIVTRVGRKARRFEFSMADAEKAKLTNKQGPWQEYPDRMLIARARSFALRDVFPDVLLGLDKSAEELGDIPPDEPPRMKDVTPPRPEGGDFAQPSPAPAEPAPCAPKPVATFTLDGVEGSWPKTRRGILAACEAILAVVEVDPGAALRNETFLTRACELWPEIVLEIRDKARAALTPGTAEAETDDNAEAQEELADPADFPEPNPFDIGQRMAERRGAPPKDFTSEMDEVLG